MDRLRAMGAFVRIAERGSFKRAAEDLGMSSGTATILIQELERHLGVRLLQRSTRRLSLTDEGRSYLERCLRILADVEEAEEALGGDGQPRGRLRVHAPIGFAHKLLAPALPDFLARHPLLSVELFSRDRFPDFVADQTDLGIYVGKVPETGVIVRTLGHFPLVTCASPAYLARHGTPRAPAELQRHDCINLISSQLGKPTDWHFQRKGQELLMKVAGRASFEASDAAIAAGIAGAGMLQMISYLVADHLAAGRLRTVLRNWTHPGPAVSVVYPQQRFVPAKLRAFVDFLAELSGRATGRRRPGAAPGAHDFAARPR